LQGVHDSKKFENLWSIVKDKLEGHKSKNIEEFKLAARKAWESIPVETCQKLVMSFKKRAEVVYRAKGMHSEY
jgi:hypothetical protein